MHVCAEALLPWTAHEQRWDTLRVTFCTKSVVTLCYANHQKGKTACTSMTNEPMLLGLTCCWPCGCCAAGWP
jgi:hypothetical protein